MDINMLYVILVSSIVGLVISDFLKLFITEKYYKVRYSGLLTLPLFVVLLPSCYTNFHKSIRHKHRISFIRLLLIYLSTYNEFTYLVAEGTLKLKRITSKKRVIKFRTFKNSLRKDIIEELNDGILMTY